MKCVRFVTMALLFLALPSIASTNHLVSFRQKIASLNVVQDGNSGGRIESLYDANANLVEERKFDGGKNLLEKFEYTYDTNNNKIRAVYYNCFGWLCGREEYTYDGKGNVLSESRYFNGSLLGQENFPNKKPSVQVSTNVTLNDKVEYLYDKAGNKIKAIKIDCDGNVCYIDELNYTNTGKLVIQTRSLGKKILSRSEFKYDASGFKTEEVTYTSNNVKTGRSTFLNDAKGRMYRQINYSADGYLIDTRTYTYDDHQNIIGMSAFDAKGQKSGNITKIYDYNDLCVEMDEYNGSGDLIRKQLWQYDDKKNVTHDVVYLYKNTQPVCIQDIEFKYVY